MERIVFFIEQIAPGLYILAGLGVFLGLRRYLRARSELIHAQFELEKEIAISHLRNRLTLILALLEAGLAVFAIAQVAAPALRANPVVASAQVQEVIETPFVTAAPNGTPVVQPLEGVDLPDVEEELGLNRPFTTPVPTATPVGTIIPGVPDALGCDPDTANLIIPTNGMRVFEPITVNGTANVENFSSYKFELNGPATNNTWSPITTFTSPVEDGEMGVFIPSYVPGQYRFRLVVFDINAELQASCTITIIISAPIPTATPIT